MGAIELYNGYYYTGKLSQLIGQLVHPVGGKGMDTEGGWGDGYFSQLKVSLYKST